MSFDNENEERFNDLNKRFDQLLEVVIRQNEVLKKVPDQILECLDFAYLNGRKLIYVLKLVQRVSPQLSEPDQESIRKLIAEMTAKDQELNAAIMAMKSKWTPLLPPLPKREDGSA